MKRTLNRHIRKSILQSCIPNKMRTRGIGDPLQCSETFDCTGLEMNNSCIDETTVNMPNLNEESASPSPDIDVTDESIDRVFNEEKDNTCPLYTSSQNINELNLADELLTFFIFFNLTRDCMQHLLSMFNRHGVRVPQTIYL